MSTVENLQNALRSFINIDNEDILQMLASILEYDSSRNPSKGTLTYGHLEKRFSRSKELIKDALSWAAQWRLILPVEKTGIRGMFWGDRKEILTKPVSKYDVLRIIQHLVDNAVKTGEWDAEHAVKSIFNDMSDVENELGLSILKKIAELVKEDYREEMLADFPYFFMPMSLFQKALQEFDITETKEVDGWVERLRAMEIVSPDNRNASFTIGDLGFSFELNPSLIILLKKAI